MLFQIRFPPFIHLDPIPEPRKRKRSRKLWTAEEIDILRKRYPHEYTCDIAKDLGRTKESLFGMAGKLGLRKSEQFKEMDRMEKSKNPPAHLKATQFKKGHISWNKGKKIEYQSEAMKATQFKKGHKPANTLYDGAITIRHRNKRRGEKPYKWIRITKGEWKMLHVHVWEELNGPTPDGMIIVFKDGDTMNCDIKNLEMISLQENMKRNTIQNYPEEIIQLIRLNAKLNKTIQDAT